MDGRCRRRRDHMLYTRSICRHLPTALARGECRPWDERETSCPSSTCHAVFRREEEVFRVFIRCRRSIRSAPRPMVDLLSSCTEQSRYTTSMVACTHHAERRTEAQRQRHDRRRIRCPFRQPLQARRPVRYVMLSERDSDV